MMVRTFFLAFIIFDNRIIDDFNIRVPLTNTRIKNWRTSEVKKKKKKKTRQIADVCSNTSQNIYVNIKIKHKWINIL